MFTAGRHDRAVKRLPHGARSAQAAGPETDETTLCRLSRWIPIIAGAIAGGVIALIVAGASNSNHSVTTTVYQQGGSSAIPTSQTWTTTRENRSTHLSTQLTCPSIHTAARRNRRH